MNFIEYFSPGVSSIEEVKAAYGPIMDASTLDKVTSCPRWHQIRVEENLQHVGGASIPMVAGIAIHAGLEFYYSHANRTPEVQSASERVLREGWRSFDLKPDPHDKKYAHLTEDNLAEILKNYYLYWGTQVTEVYEPIIIRYADLDLSRVIAALFRLNEDGDIIIGESKLIMHFDVFGETLILAGKPDLPVISQDGKLWSMDHKTSSQYLSEYWAASHEVSNKDRGYMAMLEALTGRRVYGTVINAIYVGSSALSPKSNATRFTRYQFDFSPDHVMEALQNQLAWRKTIDFHRQNGYFPQGCGYGGCENPDLCRSDVAVREEVKRRDYVQSTREFWSL